MIPVYIQPPNKPDKERHVCEAPVDATDKEVFDRVMYAVNGFDPLDVLDIKVIRRGKQREPRWSIVYKYDFDIQQTGYKLARH
jgi:hypothetical protein